MSAVARRQRGAERRIATERIGILFRLAEGRALARDFSHANRYTSLALRIGTRYNVRIPREFRRRFCRSCHAYLLPSVNCRVRVRQGRITVTCGACGAVRRMPYLREQAQ